MSLVITDLLPLISKVIEKAIYDQASTFLNSRNLLYTYQSGFQKKHSTDFCLSYLNDKILKGFDNGLMTGMILHNLKKALDTIDHDEIYKHWKRTINWFKSHLCYRSFLVTLGYDFSQPASVSCGVRQGSILGPLLFFYMSMACHKLSNAIFFSMLIIHVLLVNIKMLIKLKNS